MRKTGIGIVVGVVVVLGVLPRHAHAQTRLVVDTAAELGGGRVHVAGGDAPADPGLTGLALGARAYSAKGHGGALRVGREAEMTLFGNRVTSAYEFADFAYAYRAVPWKPGVYVVPSVLVGPTVMNVERSYSTPCSQACSSDLEWHFLDNLALGGVAGASFDVQLGGFLLGLDGAYRLGLPVHGTTATLDSAWNASLRVGGTMAVLDPSKRPR